MAVETSEASPWRARSGTLLHRPFPALLLVSGAVLLAMSPWFTAAAAGALLQERYDLGTGQLAWLTGAVQIGFVAGTLAAAVLNLADILPAGRYFGVSALLAAASNALLLVAPGWVTLLLFRFLTGFFLAGVYPPAMKMAATWFRSRRGMAIGTVVGALTVGKAIPFLLRAAGEAPAIPVIPGASFAAVLGGGLILAAYRDGPHPFPRRPFRWGLVVEVVRDRKTRLATYGYLGHMWELYAMWGTVSLFLAAHLSGQRPDPGSAAAGWAFWIIAAGGVGAVVAGVVADRWGRERVAGGAMFLSGGLALGVGWLVQAPSWVVLPLLLLWGVAVVADSAQFSALVTEVAPPHAAGTALTLQTSVGFLLTIVTLTTVPLVAEAFGWGVAFALLAPGPALGILAMVRLERLRGDPSRGRV
ncbi:MAG: MFS transporter [Gemmatimonadales bacterium]|nr:MAG: MFS transporter [Gemmatimonadales bacterium]